MHEGVVAGGARRTRAREAVQGGLALNLAPSCAAAAKIPAHQVWEAILLRGVLIFK
ncbi:hypothetical protein [uncultured Campylobacter sp.]|uniref:hypothetical protein n=1 Tax=uncultured Campylobacter sp. TaxID=218934 RepID=UPI00262A4111|nr:hypothetical protein [uncultured Campylobacter sp.]